MEFAAIVKMVRVSLGCAVSCLCGSVLAQDVPVSVTLPDYVKWCTPIVLSADAAAVEENQQAARRAAVGKMDALLLEAKGTTSGFPFVANTKKLKIKNAAGKDVDSISMDICYVVAASVPTPPAGSVFASKSTGERVASLACARASEEKCIERLQLALSGATPAVQIEKVRDWPWRYVATLAPPVGPDAYAKALTDSGSRPILGDVSVSVFGDVKPPDPKVMRPLVGKGTGSVITVAAEQGQWFVTAVVLP